MSGQPEGASDVRGQEQRARQSVLVELNARVHGAATEFTTGDRASHLWDFTCECGSPGCFVQVSLTLEQYEALRAAGRPVFAVGHEPAQRGRRRTTRESQPGA